MHDPVDQQREPSSHTGSRGRAAAAPLIQLDQSPAIEPVVGVDQTVDEASGNHPKKPVLAVPTMWR